jgi:hypothetical protein
MLYLTIGQELIPGALETHRLAGQGGRDAS